MVKKEVRPGEGSKEERRGQLVRREDAPLVPETDTERKPQALLRATLKGQKRTRHKLSSKHDLEITETEFELENITPGIKTDKDKSGENSEPTASE